MPSSSSWPPASRNFISVACRGAGSCPRSTCAIRRTAGPEVRTMPTPPRPEGVATAAIVSRATCSALGMGRLVAVEQPLDLPLLQDGKNVVHQPIKHQAGGKEEEEDAEDKRHELHDLRLYRIGWCRIHACLQHHRDSHEDGQHEVRIERGKILNPKDERRVAQLDRREQYPIERDEHRDLHEKRKAATKRIDILRLIK